jgi:ABC-2 type transport system permease protein
MTDFNVIRVAVNDDVEARVRPVLERYEAQIQRQQAAIDRLRYVSPAILMQDALNDVAGTGTSRHQRFMEQVAHYHDEWRGYFTPLIFEKAYVTDVTASPRFTFVEEPAGLVAGRVAWSLAGLAAPAFLLAWAARSRLRRYPVVG